jgi:hypothetical protein
VTRVASRPDTSLNSGNSRLRWWVLLLAAIALSSSYDEDDVIGPVADLLDSRKESPLTTEEERLEAARAGKAAWRRWGPYLSERNGERCVRTTVHPAQQCAAALPGHFRFGACAAARQRAQASNDVGHLGGGFTPFETHAAGILAHDTGGNASALHFPERCGCRLQVHERKRPQALRRRQERACRTDV